MKNIINIFKLLVVKPWKWYCRQYKGKWYQRTVTPIATLFVLFYLYLAAVDVNFLWLFGKSPDMTSIENPVNAEASLIYSSDGVVIGKFYRENRSPVDFESISPYVIDALVTTEDERFYQHHGIDYQGLFAAFKDMLHGRARGGSTITQQLVKNMFKIRSQYSTGLIGKVPGLNIFVQKSKEWITAIKIENHFSKKEILTMYLNTVDFGSNAFGIKTASKTYFNTTPASLTPEQAATLIGLLKATTTYNPKVNPENSFNRRNVVLNNMLTHGKLTQKEYDKLIKIPIKLEYRQENTYDGQAFYFREAVREYLKPWSEKNDVDIFTAGYKIYTTVDTRMQRYAEEAVQQEMSIIQDRFDGHWRGMTPWRNARGQEIPDFIENIATTTEYYKILDKKYSGNKDSIDHYMNLPHQVKVFSYSSPNREVVKTMSTMDSIRYMVKYMHCSLVAMEPKTSFVRAWVGDIDFKSWKYDKASAIRQPGSTFKLFVYAAAMEKAGMTPVDRESDTYIHMNVRDRKTGEVKAWNPHNADGKITNRSYTLSQAFAMSINTVAVKLGQKAGISNVIDVAHNMGIKSQLEDAPSLALGPSDVSLVELVDAYSCAVNDGIQRDPILVTKIVDRDGNVVYDYEKDGPESKQAISYKTAFYLQCLLWGGMREGGNTNGALWRYVRQFGNTDFGAKTGTSSNHSDAWFVSATPELVGGCWVGGEYRSIHFRTGALGQGNKTALPIYGRFLEKVLRDPNFSQYRKKFSGPKESIPQNTYNRAFGR